MGNGEVSRFRRATDYIFGRNTLIGAAALMLLAISGYATWAGMTDFILGVQGGAAATGDREIAPGLSVSTEGLIILLVVALTFLMWLALRETFGARRAFGARLVTLPLYLFLALWSVGFGYGFWWSLIAGPEATKAGLSGQAEDVRDAAVVVKARLEAVRARLDSVGAYSERQMAREAASGGTCGRASGAGRGPLFRAREGVRDSVAALQNNISGSWLAAVERDLEQLNGQMRDASLGVAGDTVAARQAAFETAAAEIRGKARAIAARSNALGASYAAEMRQIASEVSIEPGQTGFSCFDPSLAALLTEAADEASASVNVTLRDAAFSEGAAGVANAVLGLWRNLGTYAAALPAYVAGDLPEEGVAAENTTDRITGRDLIALLAAIGVDLGLFALTVLNPPTAAPARYDSLDDTLQRLKEPSDTLINELSKVFKTVLEVAPNTKLDWVRRHFFSHLGYSYFVIPSLARVGTDDRDNPIGRRALAVNQLAGVMTKLQLVQALDRPRRTSLRRVNRSIGNYESEARWVEALDAASRSVDLVSLKAASESEPDDAYDFQNTVSRWPFAKVQLRKYRPDFLEKAKKTLEIAEWSGAALEKPEIYFVYHREGLEPILTVLERGEAPGPGSEGETRALPSN